MPDLTPYQQFMGWGGPGQPQTWEQGMFGPTGSATGEGATPAQLARTTPAYIQGMPPIGQDAGTPTVPPMMQNMTPQQRALFIQMLMNRGTAGMQQPGMGNLGNALLAQQMGGQVPGGMGAPQGGGLAQNPALMQYLMGLGGGAASQPTLAQLLAMRQQQQGGMNQWQPYGPAP